MSPDLPPYAAAYLHVPVLSPQEPVTSLTKPELCCAASHALPGARALHHPHGVSPHLTEWYTPSPVQELLMELMLPPSNTAWPHAPLPRHHLRSPRYLPAVLCCLGARALNDAPTHHPPIIPPPLPAQ